MSKKRTIVISLGSLNVGGAEMRTLELLKEMKVRSAPFRFVIFVVSGRRGALDKEFELVCDRIVYSRPGWRSMWDLFHICMRERPAVLHVNALLASGFYTFAGLLAGVRARVSHIRSMGYDRNDLITRCRNALFRTLTNIASTHVVGVCDGTYGIVRAPARKWRTIYNGVRNLGPLSAQHDGPISVLFLGRLHLPKNPDRAIDVLEALRACSGGENAVLRLVGDSTSEVSSRLRSKIAERRLERATLLEGQTEHPFDAIRSADVLLLTSTREGLPGVVLEALSCGVPVVASRLPGVEEISRKTSGVRMLDLTESDQMWAEAIIEQKQCKKAQIAADFRESPFIFEHHYRSMISLWSEG